MKSPPAGVRLTMETVCLMKGIKPVKVAAPDGRGKIDDYWEPAKKMMNDTQFLNTLFNYDKDNIPDETVEKVRPYLDDPNFDPDIVAKSSGQSWSVTTYYPWPGPVPTAPSNRNYDGGFATAMMLKDLKLAQDAAAKAGASTPLGAQTEALFQMFNGLGYGGRDFSAILQMLRGKLDELPKG